MLAWLALIFVLSLARAVCSSRRGEAAARTTDRPLGPPQPVSPWISDHPATAGVCSFSGPSPHCGDAGVEMGWLWVSDFVHLRSVPGIFAWPAGLGGLAVRVRSP